jgi:hypothetical protein
MTALAFAASPPADPASTTAAGLREHLATSAGPWQTYAVLLAVCSAVMAVFSAHLRTVLVGAARRTGRGAALPDIAFGSGLLVAGWLMLSAGFTGAAAFGDLDQTSDVVLEALWSLGAAADMVGVAAFTVKGLLMVVTAIVVLRSGALGAWIGWLSLLLGVVTWAAILVPALFYAGIFAFALWPLAVSVALLVRGRRPGGVPVAV